MDDRRALLAAIIANPDEDTPRLLLADWLQEHGDKHEQARAEFIRLQVQHRYTPDGRKREALAAQALKLELAHRKAWLKPLTAIDKKLTGDFIYFNRGLLAYLFVTTSDFLLKSWQTALPDALAAVGVEELCFYFPTKRSKDFAASPALRWVARVQYPGADDAGLVAFGRASNLDHLSGLELQEVRFSDAGLRSFAETTAMTRLRSLTITTEGGLTDIRPKFTAAGILALLGSHHLPRLDALDIGGISAARFDTAMFFADAGLKRLTALTLGCRVPLADVVACPHLSNLRRLTLEDCVMTDADANALLTSPTFANLTALVLTLPTPLSAATEKKLNKRFGKGLMLEYEDEE